MLFSHVLPLLSHSLLLSSSPSVSPAVQEARFDDLKTPNIRLTPVEDEPHEPAAVESSHHFKAPAADITNPRPAPQHVASTAMDRNPPPIPGIGVPHNVPVSVHYTATDPPPLPKPTQPVSSALSMNLNLQKPTLVVHTYPLSSGLKPLPRLEDSYTAAPLKPSPVDDVLVSEQKTQSLNISTFSTWNMNKVPESARTETDPQIHNGNINRDDQVSAKPVKNLDYLKNLIREHGGVKPATNETNNYKRRVDDTKVEKVKNQKLCKYFNRAKGCRLGESCLYLHVRSKKSWTDVAPHFPKAKRLKFGS